LLGGVNVLAEADQEGRSAWVAGKGNTYIRSGLGIFCVPILDSDLVILVEAQPMANANTKTHETIRVRYLHHQAFYDGIRVKFQHFSFPKNTEMESKG
jgi:hypothetical protein